MLEQSYCLLSFVFVDVAVSQQLQEYEEKIFGSIDTTNQTLAFPPVAAPSFGFGFPKANNGVPIPAFNNVGAPSIFARPTLDIPPQEFTFGAGQTQSNISGSPFNVNPPNPNASDISMDSTWDSCFYTPFADQLLEGRKLGADSNEFFFIWM